MIISLFSERLAEEEDKVITQGTGTGQPTGLTYCNITNVACSGNLSFDDIINLIYALPSKYRRNAKFLVNNANIRELRKLQDGSARYLWQDAVAPGQPGTIYGYLRGMPLLIEGLRAKAVNCWKLLTLYARTISSQAMPVMV